MEIKIHSIHFDADQKLIEFIEKKVGKLVQFYDNILGAEIFLRLDKDQSLENKLVEIKLAIPKNDLFAKKQSRTFEESTDNAVEALRRQLQKTKEKQRGV